MDTLSKVITLRCSWIKRLHDNSSHPPWKIIPSYLINTYLRKHFKFHSNLGIPANKIKRFPVHYKQIFKRCSENLSSFPSLPSVIASQVIWYNKCIKVGSEAVYNFKISRKNINHVWQLFKCDGKPKLWEELKTEFDIQGKLHFIDNQIIHSILKSWKDPLMANSEYIKNLVYQDHHLWKVIKSIVWTNWIARKSILYWLNLMIQNLLSNCTTKMFFEIQILIGKLFIC